jgi:hypothetical protein
MADRSFCCDDNMTVELSSTIPASKIAASAPATYTINAFIYGGFAPYTVTIDWGDGLNDLTSDPIIISGIQSFTLTTDVRPEGNPQSFQHTYVSAGTYNVSFDVADDPDVFGCNSSLTQQVSPFNIGNPPTIDAEVRRDFASNYPAFNFQDITAGYNFSLTDPSNWDNNPTYHVLSQVKNTDIEDGKPREFNWQFDNPNALTFQVWYENVSGVVETITFTNGSGVLANDLVQQHSLSLWKGTTNFEEDTDFTVAWDTGVVTVASSGSIGLNETSVNAHYFHYQDASSVADVNAGQWVQLGTGNLTNSRINIRGLTSRRDLNTLRFKVRE